MPRFKDEPIYNDSNWHELVGDGKAVIAGGEKRLLSRTKPPAGADPGQFSTKFEDSGLKLIDRAEWDDRIEAQAKAKARVSDFCDFPPWDQDGLPTCWANGPTQCGAVQRRIQGLPFKCLSACSLAVPISGGHSGGWEGDALEYMAKYGAASTDTWPENNTSRRLNDDEAVKADREFHKALEWIDCGSDPDMWATAALLTMPGAFAYDWMSHVMCMCDLVKDGKKYYHRVRNSWGNWGAKNDLGYAGFALYEMGRRGTPNSGYVLRQMTASTK